MNKELTLAITGATGRMGQELIASAQARRSVENVHAVTQSANELDTKTEMTVVDESNFDSHLERSTVDVVIDFTAPAPSLRYLTAAAETQTAAVVGTTGYTDDAERTLQQVTEDIPFLRATNFSRGIAALRRALRTAVSALGSYDIELTETHHNGKQDAPSGTALTLLDDITAVCERVAESERVHGRVGEQPRSAEEIGIHARRAGNVAGKHEILLAGNDEEITLTHRAGSRSVFAAGALDAAEWLSDQPPGAYDFDAVLDTD